MKVLIADSQLLTREGLAALVDKIDGFECVGTCTSKDELFATLKQLKPSIVIIDVAGLQGFSLQDVPELLTYVHLSRILLVSSSDTKDFILAVLETGISHFILKSCSQSEFTQAVASIDKVEKFLCKEVIDVLLQENAIFNKRAIEPILTKKEVAIVKLIAEGYSTKEIAEKEFLSIHTINTHRKNIIKKLNIKTVSELVKYAIRSGIVDATEYYI